MAKNRKTVFKHFSYLQCDDFAAYLSSMASKGWHFKEWGVGLVFEKSEPEQAVYAVEVFIHGSQYDLKPDDHTMNFSDYCEAAGWKLIDSKQKYCIFKQIRPDAVPIVTPEERLQNAAKAYRGQLIWQVVLSLLWICNLLLHILPTSRLIDSLFSQINLMFILIWASYFLFIAGKCIWFGLWMRKTRKRCINGETKLLHQTKETFSTWFSILMIATMTVGFITAGESNILLVAFVTVALLLIVFILLAKFRPDRATNIGIQVVLLFVMTTLIIIAVICIIAVSDKYHPSAEEFPLVYEDLTDTVGELEDTMHTSSSSIFGSTHYYSLLYKNASLSYEIYETEHDWILDLIWEHHLTLPRNATPVDCTALWGMKSAYHNDVVDYYVRFDNAILILRVYDDLVLTEKHVAIIRDALGFED